MFSRRRFLKFGVAGGLILGAAGLTRGLHAAAAARGEELVLRERDSEVLAAVVPAMLAGVDGVRVDAVIGGVDRAIAGLPPHMQGELQQLFALLASWPGRRWIAGVRSPWRVASPEEVAAFLSSWRFSRWALLQQGYHALHELVLAAWYAPPGSWPAIGYPGPPEVT